MVLGVCLMEVMVWCVTVRRVERVAHVPRLWWGYVVIWAVVLALVVELSEAGVGGRGNVLMLPVVACHLALLELWFSCGVERLVPVAGSGVTVRWRWWALGRVLLVAVCIGVLDVGWCGVVRSGSGLGCCALSVGGCFDGPLARFGLLGLIRVGGRRPTLSSSRANDVPL